MNLLFEQIVEVPRESLFAFHTDPANLVLLLEGWKGFELLSHDGHIRPGARTRVRQAVGPTRHELLMEHFLLEPPTRFAERQIEGPFTRFEHVHEFFDAPGGTRLVDRIEFSLPEHLGGFLTEHVVAAPGLRRLFEFRHAAYARLCAAGTLR